MNLPFQPRKYTYPVRVRNCTIGGMAPISVQAMTNTHTEDIESTLSQIIDLTRAGAELVRISVNTPKSAQAVPEIRKRLDDAGLDIPLIGDFHYNGHLLLKEYPQCAEALDKYRINPGNVGSKDNKSRNFSEICSIAKDLNKPIRIGVNIGSLEPELVEQKMAENARSDTPKSSEEVYDECMLISALQSVESALELGLSHEQIVISCKSSSPVQMIRVYRLLSEHTRQPLHIGLTEAGIGIRGIVWSATSLAILLAEGIGDTIRVSLTPTPSGDRCEEVFVAQEILQSLGIRQFLPQVISCPGCGRTTNTIFQEIADSVQKYIRMHAHDWKQKYRNIEELKVAVMGCVVNGPGEARFANIGISLPGKGEQPECLVFANGQKIESIKGDVQYITQSFIQLIEQYIEKHFEKKVL